MNEDLILSHTLIDHFPQPVVLIDTGTRKFVYVNSAACRKSGYIKKEFLKLKLEDIFLSGSVKEDKKDILNIFLRKKRGFFEILQKRKDGGLIHNEAIGNIINHRGNKCFLCFFLDNSRRRKVDKLVPRDRQDWEDTFNIIPDMITIHDRDFNIIKANESARKILNLPSLKVDNEAKCYEYYHGADKPIETCPSCKCYKTGRPAHFEFYEPYLNMYVEVRAMPRFDDNNRFKGIIHVVRDITKRKQTEYSLVQSKKDLSLRAATLKETNTALKVLLKQRENDKAELEENITANFVTLVMPYIEKLKNANLMTESSKYISILESNLNEIISAFSQKLSSKYFCFTPKEIQVANLIKEGRQSKDIAEILKLSYETVNCHRQNIRKKLGIKNKKTNLRTYLLSLEK